MWKNVLICDKKFTTEGIFDQKGLEICFFHSNFEPLHCIRQFIGKMKSGCPERRERTELKISGGQCEPATLY